MLDRAVAGGGFTSFQNVAAEQPGCLRSLSLRFIETKRDIATKALLIKMLHEKFAASFTKDCSLCMQTLFLKSRLINRLPMQDFMEIKESEMQAMFT